MSLGVLADPGFPALRSFLIDTTGLAFYQGREAELAAHLGKRMAALSVPSCGAYLARLTAHDAELSALIADLTIGETYFFRYTEQFTALQQHIMPDLLKGGRRPLRLWSAGCATGPEPYSLSILLQRDLGVSDAYILGTDINQEFLKRARIAEYPEWAFRSTAPELRDTCFVRVDDRWRLADCYHKGIDFQFHNLIRDPFPAEFDVILCRNVFIYFAGDVLARLIRQFYEALSDGGWFLVGHAESNVELFRDFQTVSVPGAILYHKGPTEVSAAPLWVPPPASPSPEPLGLPPPAADLGTVRNHMDAGLWSEAEATCRRLLAIDSLDPMVHFHLALVQQQRGQDQAAQHSLRQALYLDRRFALAHYHMGILQQQHGDRRAAARCFQSTLRLLADLPADRLLFERDAVTVADLQALATLHLEAL